ncbi:MAG TPA: hypothetical protein VN750_26045 [Steroidobacteraceae bacterium]|nr:hypothetical protein [Steroidobacteraceae bacterium]
MSFRAVYKCDICREETLKANLMGCHFTDLRQFKLMDAESTQGVHICIMCLDQLRAQLAPKGIPVPAPAKDVWRGPDGHVEPR